MTQTIAWCVIFFFASAGASAAYLTVSEIFRSRCARRRSRCSSPSRSASGPSVRSSTAALIGDGTDPSTLFIGYLVGAGAMILGGIVEIFLGVEAEHKALESVAKPLSAVAPPAEGGLLPGHAALGDRHIGRRVSAKDPHWPGQVTRPPGPLPLTSERFVPFREI